MKKITLLFVFSIFIFKISLAQSANEKAFKRCATETPPPAWDEMFNEMVEKQKQIEATQNYERAKTTSYVIPIIFHVIHGGQTVGVYPNLSQAQINSQVQVLNDDYAGVGYNSNKYVNYNGHPPFYDYAITNNLPAPNTNGVVIANAPITFILATKDPNGNILPEPGIDRVDYTAHGWSNPATINSTTSLENLFDNTIKPATIWNNTKYMNVWLSDVSTKAQVLGYSTFPTGTTLSGLFGGTATATNDGTWIYAKACGNTGFLTSYYNKGRTLTHESGHYLGLRHIWGDGNNQIGYCQTDYCDDTPQAYDLNQIGLGTGSGNGTYPYNIGTCPNGSFNNSQDGEMFMNFMDYSLDDALWMFTNDQLTRMTTALSQSPVRSGLTASAASMTSGIEKVNFDALVNVYPNPIQNNQINIDIHLPTSNDVAVSFQNLLGQEIFTKKESNVQHQTFTYNLPLLEKGIYILVISSNNQKTVKRIVIQ